MDEEQVVDSDSTTTLSDSDVIDSLDLQSDDVSVEAVTLQTLEDDIVMFNNNMVYIGAILVVEIGIIIGIKLGFVFKGISKK